MEVVLLEDMEEAVGVVDLGVEAVVGVIQEVAEGDLGVRC